jgi:hypothetical protein
MNSIARKLPVPALLMFLASPVLAATTPGTTGSSSSITRCSTRDVSKTEAQGVADQITQFKLHGGGPKIGTIRVAFHVITCGGAGDVPQSQIDAQIDELNNAYRGTGFSFELASVDRTEDCQSFKNMTSPGVERSTKQRLAIDPAHRLNVYTASLGHFLLGWSYFPQSFPETDPMHGVVMHYGTLPGSFLAPYNLGGTLDHEVGHYLGLFHTFQNGCSDPGDFIDDTPFEAGPAFGCPIGRNTCPQPGDDPIHNYMDYTDDACYSEFTPLQADRMQFIVPIYRPSLFDPSSMAPRGPVAELASSPASESNLRFRGAYPNPFSNETVLRFAVPRAGEGSLKLYNVAGQLVSILAQGRFEAGEQSITLRSDRLAPGMYFAALRYGGVTVTRSVLLVP